MNTHLQHGSDCVPLDEAQMRSIVMLLDAYDADPAQARLMLDRLYAEGRLADAHRRAVRILFLLPAADANEVLAGACMDEGARRAFLRLRGQ